MHEERFERWEDFRAFVSRERFDVPVYWRGQVEPSWPLSSSFDRVILQILGWDQEKARSGESEITEFSLRNLPPGFVSRARKLYLEEFKEAASGLRGPNPAPLDDDQWWALGRHFGLISPLLDWTEKPYIAAFFALAPTQNHLLETTESLVQQEVTMYRLVHDRRLDGDGLRVLKVHVDEVPRLHDQRGIFTLLESDEYFDLRHFLEETGRGDLLTRITLAGEALREGAIDLDDNGIDYRRLFPDLSGAALHANFVLQRMARGAMGKRRA